jgi:excisionase family DNA binding protein
MSEYGKEELMEMIGSQIENSLIVAFSKWQQSFKKAKEEKFMSIKEASELLKCSESTLYRRIHDKSLSAHKIGRITRLKSTEIENALVKLEMKGGYYGF